MDNRPLAQATASRNHIVNVYADRVEIVSGWQGQNVEELPHREISEATVKGLVNCTLIIETNKGKVIRLENLGLSEANALRTAIARQKQKAGLYD